LAYVNEAFQQKLPPGGRTLPDPTLPKTSMPPSSNSVRTGATPRGGMPWLAPLGPPLYD